MKELGPYDSWEQKAQLYRKQAGEWENRADQLDRWASRARARRQDALENWEFCSITRSMIREKERRASDLREDAEHMRTVADKIERRHL